MAQKYTTTQKFGIMFSFSFTITF